MSPAKEKILDQLMTLQFASVNNFYSPDAVNTLGCNHQPSRHFDWLLRHGFIRELPMDEPIGNSRQKKFYTITKKGARAIDRQDDYTYMEYKAISNIKHESMKIDIAMAFLRNYDELTDFHYNWIIDHKKPDILVQTGKYIFVVEIERKRTPGRIIQETCKKWENVNFKNFGLPHQTKVLIVYASMSFPVFYRPIDYAPFHDSAEKNLMELVKRAGGLPDSFRSMHFKDFENLVGPVWYTPEGKRVLLINK